MFFRFMGGTINQVTMAGALRRSNTYVDKVKDKEKLKFRRDVCERLEAMMPQYAANVNEQDHVNNIKALKAFAERRHGHILKKRRLKVGVAQKALNLYLKLQWAQGRIPEPPHCPLDAIIIGKLPKKYSCKWTEMDSMDEYSKLIEAVRARAKESGKSIAVWELDEYGGGPDA